jgi:hypothetical protein
LVSAFEGQNFFKERVIRYGECSGI